MRARARKMMTARIYRRVRAPFGFREVETLGVSVIEFNAQGFIINHGTGGNRLKTKTGRG
jgi:hypothetical protein